MFATEPFTTAKLFSTVSTGSATGPISPDAIAVVLAAHRRHGYEAGYGRAIADVLAAAVFMAEKALATARDPADGRQVVYRFIELLQKDTLAHAQTDQTVSDGLGI